MPPADAEEEAQPPLEPAVTVEPRLDAAPPLPPPPADVSFRNGAAVRVGFVAAAMMQLLTTVSAAVGASLLMPFILFAGGFFSVSLYRRRTGSGLSVANGARIGWITGVFAFVIMTVFFTLGMAAMAGSGELLKAYRESASSLGLPQEAADQVQKVLNDPSSFALSIVFGLGLQFLVLTLVCSLGGALGARFQARR